MQLWRAFTRHNRNMGIMMSCASITNDKLKLFKKLKKEFEDIGNLHKEKYISPSDIDEEFIWDHLVVALATTRTNVATLEKKGFEKDSLSWSKLKNLDDDTLRETAHKAFKSGGNSTPQQNSKYLVKNREILIDKSRFDIDVLHKIKIGNVASERSAAKELQNFVGIAQKQSRNILRNMKVSKMLIPIDSRWIKLLREHAIVDSEFYDKRNLVSPLGFRLLEDVLIYAADELKITPNHLDSIVFNRNNQD